MESKERDRWRLISRRVGLAIGTLAAAFWVFIIIASVVDGIEDLDLESGIMTGLITISVGAVILAWKWENTGSIALIVDGILFMLFAWFSAGRNKGLAMAVSGGPFFVAGVLIWMSAFRMESKPPKRDEA